MILSFEDGKLKVVKNIAWVNRNYENWEVISGDYYSVIMVLVDIIINKIKILMQGGQDNPNGKYAKNEQDLKAEEKEKKRQLDIERLQQ